MLFYNCSVFVYSTVAGRKYEINSVKCPCNIFNVKCHYNLCFHNNNNNKTALSLPAKSADRYQVTQQTVTYRVGQKMAQFVLNTLTLSNINRFSKFFHCQNQEKICDNIITKDPTTLQVCRYTTLWNVSVLKATIENKTTSV